MHLGYFWLCPVVLQLVTLLEPWLCTSDMWALHGARYQSHSPSKRCFGHLC